MAERGPGDELSWQAERLLLLLAAGCTTEEIAADLNVEPVGVEAALEELRSFFGAFNNTHLVIRAYLCGFLSRVQLLSVDKELAGVD